MDEIAKKATAAAPNTLALAGVGAGVGAVVGLLAFGPVGAAVLGGLCGAAGGYGGAKKDVK